MNTKKPTIETGTECRFNLNSITPREFDSDTLSDKQVKALENKVCIVEGFDTGETGVRDFEYYNVKFLDGTEIEDCSGFHLTPVKELKQN